jgi:hypothetical protein
MESKTKILTTAKTLKEIKQKVVEILKENELSILSDYRILTKKDSGKFAIQLNEKGEKTSPTISEIKILLQKKLGRNIVLKIMGNFLSVETTEPCDNGQENASTKNPVEEEKIDFCEFEKQLIDFLEHLNSSSKAQNHGYQLTSLKEKGVVLIQGVTMSSFRNIARNLEVIPFYSKRIKATVEAKTIYVSCEERANMVEPMSLANKFIQRLRDSINGLSSMLEIETPMIFIASAKSIAEVSIKSLLSENLKSFKKRIHPEWNPRIDEDNPLRLIISITWEQIQEFIDGKEIISATPLIYEEPSVVKKVVKPIPTPPPIKKSEKPIEKEKEKVLPETKIPLEKAKSENPTTPVLNAVTPTNTIGQLSDCHVYESFDYNSFHFFPFNRETNTRHVRKIMRSIEMFGILSFVIVVETDCIDGEMKKWIVDGQHRFKALILLGKPIIYIEVKLNTKEEIVKLVAELNTTSRSWNLKDYLHVWSSLDISQYLTIDKYLKSTGLPITVILEIFSGLDRTQASMNFRNGDFVVKDEEKSIERVSWIMEAKELLPRSREILSALVVFINQTKNYDNGKMLASLKQSKKDGLNFFIAGETSDQIIKKIKILYDMRS